MVKVGVSGACLGNGRIGMEIVVAMSFLPEASTNIDATGRKIQLFRCVKGLSLQRYK